MAVNIVCSRRNKKRGISMLNLMRKHASSWMIKVLLFAIVVVFSFWGVGSFRDRKATQVAKINGEVVTFTYAVRIVEHQ